jgi:uncharacterized protein (DUF1501 family)
MNGHHDAAFADGLPAFASARRRLLAAGASGLTLGSWLQPVSALAAPTPRLLVLIELRGGNDGLNTVLPADRSRYHALRPRIGLRDEATASFGDELALHGALSGWRELWDRGEMAIVQGVGYDPPNLSHFRSIEIWDTASDSQQYLGQGWLTRAAQAAQFASFSADGVIVGAADLGPFGGGARAVALADPERFARQARLAGSGTTSARGALAHVVRVEADITRAGAGLRSDVRFATEFPRDPFGVAVRNACAVAATRRVPVVRLTLPGFDTHQNQLAVQANLLQRLAAGVLALRSALAEAGVWQDTLVLTYSEFGRRPRENANGGTDHGTASVSFAFGPNVVRGVYGAAPDLHQLDAGGNLQHTVDFRALYATVLERWWQLDSRVVLGRSFAALPLLRA